MSRILSFGFRNESAFTVDTQFFPMSHSLMIVLIAIPIDFVHNYGEVETIPFIEHLFFFTFVVVVHLYIDISIVG